MNETKLQSALLGGIITLAITISVLLRRDKDIRQTLFTVFSGNLSLYYFSSFAFYLFGVTWVERLSLVLATTIPIGGIFFFRTFSPAERKSRQKLVRLATVLAVLLIAMCIYPGGMKPALGPAIMAYVLGFMLVAIFDLNVQAKKAATQLDATRIRYLAGGGLVALFFQLVDRFDQLFDIYVPPIGLAMTLLYLYFISQSIVRYRILDLYELFGRLLVMTMMGFLLAFIYVMLVELVGTGKGFFLNAFLASLVILLLFDPLHDFVEQKISDFFFGERMFFEQFVTELGFRLAHILDLETMNRTLLSGLEKSRRVTHAAMYLLDYQGSGFDLRDWVGPEPERSRVDVVTVRRYFRGVAAGGAVVASNLRSRRERSLQEGKGASTEDVKEALSILERLNADVLLFIEGEEDLLGIVSLKDEKIRDNFSADEVKVLAQLASQVSVVVENTKLYKQMKERDRLAVLGQMSAGMAHEIRNPLGAIKAAAQFIEEDIYEQSDKKEDAEDIEYLSIIVEEANRLNRVVNDFLSYARPSTGQPSDVSPNEIVQKTVQVFAAGNTSTAEITLDLDDDVPTVYIDGERLHQAFLNLIINANQAMANQEDGELKISTRRRKFRRLTRDTGESENTELVEIRFADNGPGIEPSVQENIFIPFYTTKQSGSGLGLAVCQRLIRDAGGDIEVRSQVEQGSIFSVILPISAHRTSQNAE